MAATRLFLKNGSDFTCNLRIGNGRGGYGLDGICGLGPDGNALTVPTTEMVTASLPYAPPHIVTFFNLTCAVPCAKSNVRGAFLAAR
jgi:hypothetical protein